MTETELIRVDHGDGLAAVKALTVALNAAFTNGKPVKIHLVLSGKSNPTGFREKALTSDILKGMLDMFKPCLDSNPQIQIERTER